MFREPDAEEISDYLGVPLEDIQDCLISVSSNHVVSLNVQTGNDDGELMDSIPTPTENKDFANYYKALLHLPKLQKHVIIQVVLQYRNRDEIAGKYNISKQKLNQIKNDAVSKMRHSIMTIR